MCVCVLFGELRVLGGKDVYEKKGLITRPREEIHKWEQATLRK